MPEGDTLRRIARRLAPVLVGERVTAVWFRALRGHRPRVGYGVRRVEAVGKYLLVEFDRRRNASAARRNLQTELSSASSGGFARDKSE